MTNRVSDAEFERQYAELQLTNQRIAEIKRLSGRVERLEQALRKIEHPAHLLNEFMPNCAGCIARVALNDKEEQ